MKPRILKILELKLMPMDMCYCQTTAAGPVGAVQLVQDDVALTPPVFAGQCPALPPAADLTQFCIFSPVLH